MNPLQQKADSLPWSHVDVYFKVQGEFCPHALTIVPKSDPPRLGCPICRSVLRPDDAVKIVRAKDAEMCTITVAELLKP